MFSETHQVTVCVAYNTDSLVSMC